MSAASRFSSALGGAGTGAMLGSFIPGVGTAAGAIVGGLGGLLFGGGPDVPELQFSPESLARLDEEFPELASQIRANKVAYGDLARVVAEQRQGPTASELQGRNEYINKMQAAQSMGGMAGNPMAAAQIADAYSRVTNPMYESALQRSLSAQQALAQAGQGMAGQYGDLGRLINSAKQANIQAAMERDAARAGQQMAQYTADRQDMAGLMQGMGAITGAGFQAYMSPYASNKLWGTPIPDYLKSGGGQMTTGGSLFNFGGVT